MALKLDDKPTDSRDDNLNPQYRSAEGGHDAVDLSSKEKEAFKDIASNYADPSDAEKNASINDGQGSATNDDEQSAQDRAEDTVGSGYKKSTSRIRGRVSFGRKKAIGLGFGGLSVVTLLFVLYPIFQGPLQLINLSQLLTGAHFINNDEFGNDRTSKLTLLYRYARGGTVQATRVGAIQAKYADKWDDRLFRELGVRPAFDVDTGLFRGFIVYDETKASSFLDSIDEDVIDTNVSSNDVGVGRTGDDPPGGGRLVAIKSDPNFKSRRSVISASTDALKLNKISSIMGARTLSTLGGANFSPITNRVRSATENQFDSRREAKDQERREQIKNGVEADNGSLRTNNTTAVDADGDPIQPTGTTAEVINDADDLVGQAVNAEDPESLVNVKNLINNRILTQSAGGAAAVIGVLCATRDLGNQAEELQFSQTIMPMMRMGVEFISLGSQIISNRSLNIEDLGYYVDLLNSEEGQNVVAAASLQFEQGQEPTGPDINPEVKPNSVTGKPFLFELLDDIPVLGTACAISDGIGSFISGIPVVGNVVDIANSAFAGGIDAALSGTTGKTTEELIGSVVDWLAGESVDVLAEGPELGNIVNYGARLAANNQALASGGTVLSEQDSALLDARNQEILQQDIASMSLFERYFDVYNGESLINTALTRPLDDPQSIVASILNSPQILASTLTTQAYAQNAGSYSYGFPEIGFSAGEITNPNIQDPVILAEEIRPRLSEMNEKYGGCFPLDIDPSTEAIQLQSFNDPDLINQFNIDDGCSENKSLEFLKYRVYIADLVNAVSIDCYESGDEQSCSEIGFGGGSASEDSASGPLIGGTGEPIGLDGYKLDTIQVDSEALSCTGDLQSGARAVAEFVKERWGKSYGGYDCRGKSTNPDDLSIHAEGRAIDQFYNAFDPTELQEANETFGWLLANAESIGIQYVKYWKLQWSPSRGLRCVQDQSDIQVHSNHIHYEVNRPASSEQTPWFTNPTDLTPFTIDQGLC